MKKIKINQMELIEGGSRKAVECGLALIGLAAAGVGLATITVGTGGLALAAAAVGWSIAPTAAALSCL